MNYSHSRATLEVVVASLLWSSGGLFIKLIEWNSMAIAGMRSLIAAVTLILLTRTFRVHLSRRQFAAALAYAGVVLLFVTANKLTTAANAIILQYTAPLWVALIAPFYLHEPIRKRDIVCLAMVAAGLVLFFLDQLTFGGILGNVLALASGCCFGCLVLLLRKERGEKGHSIVIVGNLIAACIGIPWMLDGFPSLQGCFYLVLLGVFQLGLSYFLFTRAFRQISALEAMFIPMLEPLCNPLWVFLMTGERPGIWAGIGGLIVLTAVTIQNWPTKREAPA